MKRVKFLDAGRRAHPTDLRYPQLQHEAGDVHDLPDEMAVEALAARDSKGAARCELVEDLGSDDGSAPEQAAPAEPEVPKTDDSKAKDGGKREDKKGRGAKALG